MSKKLFTKFFVFLLVVGLLFAVAPIGQALAQTPTPDVTWYSDGPTSFTLMDADDLAGLAQLVNAGNNFSGKTILLGEDINLSEYTDWEPIGTGFGGVGSKTFQGTFDGQNKTISNLTSNRPTQDYVGLFGNIWGLGSVSNLKLSNVTVTGHEYVGGLTSLVYSSANVTNVDVQTATITGNHFAGSIAGYVDSGLHTDLHAVDVTVSVTYTDSDGDGDKAGGLIGYMYSGQLSDCSATDVSVTAVRNAGGLVGAAGASTITNCSVDGATVTASNATGSHASPYAGGALGQASGAVTLTSISVTDAIVSSYVPALAGTVVGGPLSNVAATGTKLTLNVGVGKAYATLADAIAAVPPNLTEVTYVLYSDQSLTATSATAPDLAKGAGKVNLVKADGVASVKLTLDGAYTGKFVALGAQLNFNGLTLANYKANGEGTDPWEFAYLMVDAASVNFDGCTIINGILISIHAVFDDCLFDSQPRYYPNLVDGKDYSLDDYALWIHNFGNVLVKNSTFQNWAYGGIKSTWNRYATGANLSLTLQDNTFVNIGNGGKHTIANLDGADSVTITGNLVIDSYTGGATTEQAALLEVDLIDPAPTITVNTNIWATPSVVYVDDGWASVPIGDDPDDAGPAIAMGYDAFASIQEGIAAVGAGGTVNVADGTYAELLTINKEITLLGPNAGISAGVTPGTRGAEATVTFPTGITKNWQELVRVASDNVIIDGFTFTYQEYLINILPNMVYAEGVDHLTIKNNIFIGGETAVDFEPSATQPYSVGLLIENNYVDSGPFVNSVYNRGFYIYSTGGVVKNNVVLNTSIGIQILPHREPTGGTVEGNVVSAYSIGLYQNNHWADSGAWSWKDNTVTMALNDRLGLKAQVNSPYTADVTFRGVHLINYGIYGGTVPPVATFEGNSIDGASVGSVGVIGVDAIRINSTDSPFVPGTTATFRENSFINYTTAINNIAYGSTSVIVDAIENWWGSIAGPAAGTIVGTAEYAPWCGDEICSFLVYPMVGTDLQASINATPAGGTLYVPAGTYTDGGADGYNVAGKTIILGDGVVIQNSSPCFTVQGSYSTITTETIGGATCVATNSSNGINVNGGLNNIVIEGIYIDMSQSGLSVSSAIWFSGSIEDVLIKDNYIHAGGTGFIQYGVGFSIKPTGLVEIKGNLFEMAGIQNCAVNNGSDTSTTTLDARFNSFGSMSGHPAKNYTLLDGGGSCSANVNYGDHTHADVYLESSATPWLNQEVVGQEFTLTVKANLTEVTGAKFTLEYDPALVELVDDSLENLSGFSAAGLNMFEVDETLGLITFNASKIPAITGTAYSLFSADFTASAVGAALFEVDALSDEFAMFPGYASSSNVYGYSLLPVTVDLIELPTVASTFGDSYYLVGEARDFTMTVTNFDTAYTAPELRITIPTGLTLAYGGTDYTGSLVVDLADLAVDEIVTIYLTATFTTPFNTTAAVLDVDLVDALSTEELLVEESFSAFAYTKPTVTIGTDPYFLVGVPGDFSVTIMNPETGRNYGDSIVFDIVIEDHVVTDISAVSCTMGTQTWDLIGELEQDDADVVARIEGLTGGFFTVPANFTAPISCSITYATPGTYAVSGYMVEGISTPERIVSDTYSATAQVYTQPVISSDNLDGPFQAGLAQGVTLTITNPSPIPEPFDLVFTLPDGTTILYNGVTYTCSSTGCPAIPLVAGAVPGDIGFTITFPVGFVGGTADISVSLIDHDTVGAPSPLATLNVPAVVVYANVASVTGTVSMQGRTTRAGVLFTLAGSFDTYTATSINTLSNNVSFTNLASGVYAITVEQARYLDITITHGATIDLATLQAIANLMLRAGDANDDNTIGPGDASIVGAQYGTGTIADQGDINFDNKVNIQDLALIGGNYDQQSTNPGAANYAYGNWMK